MFPSLRFILMAYLVMFTDTSFGQLFPYEIVECRKQKTFDLASVIKPPLAFTLYYQGGKEVTPDIDFLKAACHVMKSYPEITFTLIVGQGVKKGKKGLTCAKKDKNCTSNYEHACATKLVENFNAWVCCTVGGKCGAECIAEQDESKVEEFNQCKDLKDPNIKPDEILLNNNAEAEKIPNPSNCVPILVLNGKNVQNVDQCARFMFSEKPNRVIKALLNGNQ